MSQHSTISTRWLEYISTKVEKLLPNYNEQLEATSIKC